jgi:ribosome maturation factor RimP
VLTPESIGETFRDLLSGTSIELISVQVQPQRGRTKYVVVLDHRERGITIDELSKWSRRFEEELDMNDEVPRMYALDVTSPGATVPLTRDWQFKKNVGRKLKVELAPREGQDKAETFQDTLESASGDTLTFASGRTIQRDAIQIAQVALPW